MVSISSVLISITLLPVLGLVSGAEAPQVKDSPRNLLARAHLDTGLTKGVIEFSAKNGTVKVHMDTTGLPEEGGPFYYHIHNNAVPSNHDCSMTGTHFNPYKAPITDCDSLEDDSMCQVGDLSGKHGWINTTCFESTYYDPYLSLNSRNKAYIIGKSVNLHFQNMTIFACGTIEKTNEKVVKKRYNIVSSVQEEEYESDRFNLDGKTVAESDKNTMNIKWVTSNSTTNGTFSNSTFYSNNEDNSNGDESMTMTPDDCDNNTKTDYVSSTYMGEGNNFEFNSNFKGVVGVLLGAIIALI